MRIGQWVLVGGAMSLGFIQSAMALQNTAPAGYQWQTAWSDEFNYTGVPDSTKWNQYVTGGVFNNEAQAYTNSTKNTYVENGHLRITAIKETVTSTRGQTFNYTSGRLNTSGKYSVQYGRIEASIWIPGNAGVWPAFWTLGTQGGWPSGGEMDIFEYSGGKPLGGVTPANYINSNLIYKDANGQNRTLYHMAYLHNITPTDGYHTYALEWDENYIRWYYDDINFATAENNPNDVWAYPGTNPTNQPHYLLLNLAIGGDGGGGIDPNFSTANMYVDYVRVSKLVAVPEPASIGSLLGIGAMALMRRKRQ